ncbi:sodium channel protein Nach-like [Ceratina calcarata]|uniref:Sodium channel protein Nach-like n=1 Tax=Ceratina calcarata TaxID=156304 RepID=A0AAJ7WGU2_9HYME|nr:sodium channel protein Nach-like [Ceratina calcarata]
MIFITYYGYLESMENPLFTSVSTEQFPTHELHFPGVAICSINRISRRSAMELASEVVAANISDRSHDQILDMILQLGDLYDSEIKLQTPKQRIDQLLAILYGAAFNITDVMKRLTPDCASMLSKCRFHDEERNCTEVFTFRKTQDGFCCTFNYATKGDDTPLSSMIDHRTIPVKVQNLTEVGGLSVLLEPFLDDYFYSIFPSAGWRVSFHSTVSSSHIFNLLQLAQFYYVADKIQIFYLFIEFNVTIFNPYDYPDMTSGGVIDFLVSPKIHLRMEVQAIMSYSERAIIPYPLETRDCVFPDEMTPLRAFYTYSDCIVDCKIEDMLRICGCVPFFLPNRGSRKVCDLGDVPCLLQHKSKWFSVIPHENLYEDNGMDKEKVLLCYKCYPECSAVKYTAKQFTTVLRSNQDVVKLLGDTKIEDHAAITIFFNKFGTTRLRQDVIFRWYELMGDAASICGIFIGFNLILIVEFVYFVGCFLIELVKGPSKGKEGIKIKQTQIQTIYWGSLYSNVRTVENQRNRIHGNTLFDKTFILVCSCQLKSVFHGKTRIV